MHGLLLIKGSHPTLLHTAVLNLQGGVVGGTLCSNRCPLRVHAMGRVWAGASGMDGVWGVQGVRAAPVVVALKNLATEGPSHLPGEQQYSGKLVSLQRSSPWPTGKSWG